MRGFWIAVCGVGLFLLALSSARTLSADDIQRFYGTWVDRGYNVKACKKIEGEVAGFAIYKDKYVPFLGGFCEDVRMYMRGKRLRVTANCFSDEGGGHSAITNEFELVGRDTILVIEGFDRETFSGKSSSRNARYFRCLDCKPDEDTCVFGGDVDGDKINEEIRLRMQKECERKERVCEGGCSKCWPS